MGHTYHNLEYHIVTSTKSHTPSIRPEIRPRLDSYIGGIVREHGGALLSAGGAQDHSHGLVSAKPDVAPSDLVRAIKAASSGWIHETFPQMRGFQWQAGYSIFSVRKSREEVLRRYIRGQEEHHRKQTFMRELTALLEKHGVPFDPRYLAAD
jgi:putative transposase